MRSVRGVFVYGLILLFAVWIFGAVFISGWRPTAVHSSDDDESIVAAASDADSRARRLEAHVQRLEAIVRQQVESNDQLRRQLDTVLAAAPGGGHAFGVMAPDAGLSEPIAVLVFACNRSTAIKNHLDQLIKLRPSKDKFPIIVSQDCEHEETTRVIQSYGTQLTLIHQPDQREIVLEKKMQKFLGYYKIARHYRWALNETFFTFQYKSVIVTEDDLDLAVDFFEYFTATHKLLERDKTLMCVSAWNDNGKPDLIEDKPEMLWRTDFFPGLGWMMRVDVWNELNVKWPEAYWDDWLRMPEQRKGRACIRPEVPRTAMSAFGKVGVSRGLYFEKHLKHIALNKQFVPFTARDLTYLVKDEYDRAFAEQVYKWPSITQPELRNNKLTDGSPLPAAIRLTYEDKNTYKTTAKAFRLMDDFRAGVPRMAYRGVVAYMYDHRTRVYLAPPPTWQDYDPKWT